MAGNTDVVVIGAGIIGCAIARELARKGATVRVFESRTVGAGATQASAGVLAPYIEAPRIGPFLELGVRSLSLYDDFVRQVVDESGVAVDYRRCGTLEVAADDAQVAHLTSVMAGGALAQADAVWLDAEESRRVEPSLPETIRGAVLVRSHGYVAASQLTEALTWSAVRHGAEIETGRQITHTLHSDQGVQILAADGSRWSADAAVIATGSWAGQMGLQDAAAADVRPVRGQLLKVSWHGETLRQVVWGPDCYLVPWTDGTVLVGATVEEVGFDERPTAAGVRDLLEAMCDLLPAAWRATFQEARAGLRPATSDGLPIIGPSTSIPHVTYALGHYRNGILLAPVTAALVADWVLEHRLDPALQPFHPTRFDSRGGQAP